MDETPSRSFVEAELELEVRADGLRAKLDGGAPFFPPQPLDERDFLDRLEVLRELGTKPLLLDDDDCLPATAAASHAALVKEAVAVGERLAKMLSESARARLTALEGVAASLHQLAIVLRAQGDLDAAHKHIEKSLEIESSIFRTEIHPEFADSLRVLAMVLHNRGDLDGAGKILSDLWKLRPPFLKLKSIPMSPLRSIFMPECSGPRETSRAPGGGWSGSSRSRIAYTERANISRARSPSGSWAYYYARSASPKEARGS